MVLLLICESRGKSPCMHVEIRSCSTCTLEPMSPASARAVRVVQLISMTDSRTERLRVLLPASNSSLNCSYVPYIIQPSLMSAGFPMKLTPPSDSSHTETCSK